MQEIEQLKKMNVSTNASKVNEEKKWMVMKKENDDKIKMLDVVLKLKSNQMVENLNRRSHVFFVCKIER